jgi:hypothetical protein
MQETRLIPEAAVRGPGAFVGEQHPALSVTIMDLNRKFGASGLDLGLRVACC